MIISHKYRFIFIKTVKTAGTSIEVYLSPLCGEADVFTPIVPPVEGHEPRNHAGRFNPLPELAASFSHGEGLVTEGINSFKNLLLGKRFFPHMAAWKARCRMDRRIWNGYYKFCVERNPWDKTLSHYHMLKHRAGSDMTLDEYLNNGRFCLNHPKYADSHRLLVDRVLRYDRLNEELGEIFSRLGVPYAGSLDVQAKSGYRKDRTHYRDILTESQRDTIASIYHREIEMHGFEY